MSKSHLEADLARRIQIAGLPEPERQHLFATCVGRKHRFDFAWPDRKLAVEVDGGVHMARQGVAVGHHASLRDYRKRNLAVKLGWRVLAYRPEMIRSGDAVFDLTLLFNKELDHQAIIAKREAWHLAQESAARRKKNVKLAARRRARR